ncbi:MAG: sulfurtransferase TusA family protein [Thermacetogeniaceae bacterium]
MEPQISFDLRGSDCVYNFAKIKLALEELDEGDILEVILDEGSPFKNVSRSLKEEGHKVIEVIPGDGYFKIYVEKACS